MTVVHLLFGVLYGLATFELFSFLASLRPRRMFKFSPRKLTVVMTSWLIASIATACAVGFGLMRIYRALPWEKPVSEFSRVFELGFYTTVLIVMLLWRRNQESRGA